MAAQKTDGEDLEVTVEVLPQTVNDIVYMSEEVNSMSSAEDNSPDDEQAASLYEAGSVNPINIAQLPLVLDETQTFVILPQQSEQNGGCTNAEYTITPEGYLKKLDDNEIMCIYSCHLCNYKCISLNDLDSHIKMCKKSRDKYVCNVCGEIFERAQVLSHHFKTKHQKPVPVCNICGCPCANEAALGSHYKKHEPKQFSCNACSAEYDNAVALNNHLKTHTTTLLYACNKCDAGFSSTSEISVHLRTVHSTPTPIRRKNTLEDNADPVQVENRERVSRMRKIRQKLAKNKN